MNHATPLEKFVMTVNYIVLALIAAMMLLPFLYLFSVSFSTLEDFLRTDLLLWPKRWVTYAYEYILQSDSFLRSLWVTTKLTVTGTLINLAFTATMAFGLTRRALGQRTLLLLVLFSTLFSPGLIPNYIIVKETGLLDSTWSLILPGLISPFILIVLRTFFLNIPSELDEAARIDGANDLHIFARLILPLSKPALAAFSLYYAVGYWNGYFTAILYINNPAKQPIQVILRQIVIQSDPTSVFGGFATQMFLEHSPPPQTVQMAAILLATLPILIVYPFLQKHFVKGVMLGSIKG
ncbi:MAG: carbohydrate ABC transporter permease [Paenibacillaceae bacterium]|uniref:carbohydrate ABC transporter permease n=1 Tax=Paenibacillus cymbidii TaxID=1639034 RepID=UPI001081D4C3|nr:carbohydrate ABC transporter permease [Paenibacillus cymbidii]MBO9604548.1 carbohydrate ABC transporter permease [Paenibacillaceae bacterium]